MSKLAERLKKLLDRHAGEVKYMPSDVGNHKRGWLACIEELRPLLTKELEAEEESRLACNPARQP